MLPRIKPGTLAALIVSAVVIGLLFWVPYYLGYGQHRLSIGSYLPQAWSMEQWQHCWLVLPAIGGMLWMQRAEVLAVPLRGSWMGLPVAVFALLLYVVGYRVDNVYFGYAGIQLLIPGLVLWFAGWRMLGKLAFYCLFLVFMWPLFFLENTITFPLRVVMTNASAFVLNFLGIDVVRQGTGLISAPDPLLGIPAGKKFSVDVADPCSGIRSLFALMMVSALYAQFTLNTWWKKWILFFCSFPLAIAGNLVRILVLTLGTIAFGAEFAIGKHALTDPSWFHMAAGYAVFAVALGGMLGIGWLLANGWNCVLALRKFIAGLTSLRASESVPAAAPRTTKPKESPY